MNINYLDIEEVFAIHDYMIELGGGKGGIRDFALLHSAMERPKAGFGGIDLYPDLFKKAAALLHSLVKNHAFYDGNKRTGYFTTVRFLQINGYVLEATRKDIVKFALSIDTKNLSLVEISAWLKEHSEVH